MNTKKFVDVLDQRNAHVDSNIFEIMNILRASDYHFTANNYGSPEFSGYTHIPALFSPETCNWPSLPVKPPPVNSIWMNTFTPDVTKEWFPGIFPMIEPTRPIGQNKLEIAGGFFDVKPPNQPCCTGIAAPKVEITQKKHIDVEIKGFKDILKIIQENEYCENTEYNIDLKALMQIKDELLALDQMIGLTKFKDDILDQILYFVQNLHGGKDPDFMHTVLCGPPGTGKTEIAILLGKMYSKIGVLNKRVFKKVTRSDLVAGYLGQTAIKTKKVIDECLGGCLFIDEAYSLANDYEGDSFSRECIDTLCEALSSHKGELMVIVAGYEKELNSTFFKANPGMESRFIWRFTIDPYTHKELMQIFLKKFADNQWTCSVEIPILEKWFSKNHDNFKHFGRDVELLFSYTKISHGRRVYGKDASFRKQIDMNDIHAGLVSFRAHSTKKEKHVEIMGLYV